MSEDKKTDAVDDEEIEGADGEPLPDREVMSVVIPVSSDDVVVDPLDPGRPPVPKQ